MTGKELAQAVRKVKGKVSAPVLMGADVEYLYVEKADLIAMLMNLGDRDSGMKLEPEDGGFYLAREQD